MDYNWPDELITLRDEVAAVAAAAVVGREMREEAWVAQSDPDFSRELGRRGWLGMTWPVEYGGGGRSKLERFVVTEGLIAAGAPIGTPASPARLVSTATSRSTVRPFLMPLSRSSMV